MRIMTVRTFDPGIMNGRIDTRQVVSLAGRHSQFYMAAQAKLSAPINWQFFRILGMIQGGTMAVLARNNTVAGSGKARTILIMAFSTGFRPLVFAREILPLLLIAQAVKPEGISAILNPEISGDVKHSENQNAGYKANDHKEWTPHMSFHGILLFK
jgi:hypothetical protein